jgi:hypothetical protein
MFGHNEVQSRLPLSAPNLGIFTTFVLPLYDFRITTCGGEFWRLLSNMETWEQPVGKYLVSLLRSPRLDNTGKTDTPLTNPLSTFMKTFSISSGRKKARSHQLGMR